MIQLKIEGMSCGHCARAVSTALARVPGVKSVGEINVKRGEARVEGEPDPQALIAAVVAEGYQASVA